jgi:hypothetical protein
MSLNHLTLMHPIFVEAWQGACPYGMNALVGVESGVMGRDQRESDLPIELSKLARRALVAAG